MLSAACARTGYTQHVARTKVTLNIDDDLLRRVQIIAAREGTSVSQLMTGMLEELIRSHEDYETAKHHALAILHKGFRLEVIPLSRDALHER